MHAQVPSLPVFLQVAPGMVVGSHSLLQHTPSTQNPLSHCEERLQPTPFPRRSWQTPLSLQKWVSAQSSGAVHAFLHEVP